VLKARGFQPIFLMTRPESAQPEPMENPNSEAEFAEEIAEVERSLLSLKERYAEVQQSQSRQAELQERQREIRQTRQNQHLRQELHQIKEQLEAIELTLESRLFNWSSIKEPFWQAVRFGGLGIILGWVLKSLAK